MTGCAGGARRLLIRNARLVDGSGSPARPADLVVDGERIAAIGQPGSVSSASLRDLPVMDASGLMVCPGFIDIHSHGDLVLALPPAAQRQLLDGRISQGITTQIVGNCGLGVFPRTARSEPLLRAVVDWMTPRILADEQGGGGELAAEWPWSDLAGYLEHLENNGVWINAGTLQPHGPLRMEVAGLSRTPVDMTEAEAMGVMSRRLTEALDSGAFGMSTGLIYPPGLFASTEELATLAATMARAGGPAAFLASHIRGSSETLLEAVGELLDIGRSAGVPVQHSHSEAVGRDHWRKIETVLGMEESARTSGQPVSFDMFPYTAAATMMLAIYPPWALEGGVDRLLARLADPEARAAIGRSIETVRPSWHPRPPWTPDGWPHNLVRAVGWDRITIGSVGTEDSVGLEGMSLSDLGRARGKTPFDAISDLMIEQQGMVSQIIHGISGDDVREEGLEMLLSHPAGCVCTDADDFGKGRPHPAAFGAFPKVLGRYVRDQALLGWEEAIHKMTGRPASLLGLGDRGVLRQGACADIVVLEPGKVDGAATFDQPRRTASGIVCVMVNGSVVHADAERSAFKDQEERPAGRVLRRGR